MPSKKPKIQFLIESGFIHGTAYWNGTFYEIGSGGIRLVSELENQGKIQLRSSD